MIDLAVLKGSSFVVLGLARSGLATVRALLAAGVDCAAWDDDEPARKAAADAGARLAQPASVDWSGVTALVISPGIPNRLPRPHASGGRSCALDLVVVPGNTGDPGRQQGTHRRQAGSRQPEHDEGRTLEDGEIDHPLTSISGWRDPPSTGWRR